VKKKEFEARPPRLREKGTEGNFSVVPQGGKKAKTQDSLCSKHDSGKKENHGAAQKHRMKRGKGAEAG